MHLPISQSEIPDDLRPLAEHESDEQQRGADDALPPDAQLAPDGGHGGRGGAWGRKMRIKMLDLIS